MSTFPSFLFFFQIIPALLGKSTQKSSIRYCSNFKGTSEDFFSTRFSKKRERTQRNSHNSWKGIWRNVRFKSKWNLRRGSFSASTKSAKQLNKRQPQIESFMLASLHAIRICQFPNKNDRTFLLVAFLRSVLIKFCIFLLYFRQQIFTRHQTLLVPDKVAWRGWKDSFSHEICVLPYISDRTCVSLHERYL